MLEIARKPLNVLQMHKLRSFGRRIKKLGADFAVYDVDGRETLPFKADKDAHCHNLIAEYCHRLTRQSEDKKSVTKTVEVQCLGRDSRILAVVLRTTDEINGAAFIDCSQYTRDGQFTEGQIECLSEMLGFFAESFKAEYKADGQIEIISTELAQVYEQLVLLHKLGMNMNITGSDAGFLQMACDSLTDIVGVEGIAVLLEKDVENEKKLILSAGSGLIDINEHMAAVLYNRTVEEIGLGKEALLDSDVDSPFRYSWPGSIRNIIVVPFYSASAQRPSQSCSEASGCCGITGLMVATNRTDKPDFDSTDVKLFNSVANSCAVFIENGRLFTDLKELFVGLLKALANSIDAKDPYTRGHSERVAFISRWIAEKFVEKGILKNQDVHEIYLAGLLHDIGKVGVNELVLRKHGKLSSHEIERIKAHPLIGADILSAIKQMRRIVPGVLHHHERIDGSGYPDGLTGEQIPLMARIVGLADAFDAMTSKRTYRDAMTAAQTLAEIDKNLGSQFDKQVTKVFLESDVFQLWNTIQGNLTNVYEEGNFLEYGTVAVGSLIR